MGVIGVALGNNGERTAYIRAVRKWFKSFCLLPKTTPNTTVRLLLADLDGLFRSIMTVAEESWDRRVKGGEDDT